MYEIKENIFNYNMSELEYETLNLPYENEVLYLAFTPLFERLSDLHLLFLMRRDKPNGNRIMNMIKLIEEVEIEI